MNNSRLRSHSRPPGVMHDLGLAILLGWAAAAGSSTAAAAPASVAPVVGVAGMARVDGGFYRPLLPGINDLKQVPVSSFYLDILPVTNAGFLEFVRANPRWQKSRVKRLFADEAYLKNWAGDLDPGTNAPANSPVTFVSWFAAKAYAQWQGKRLPTIAEWERAAAASPTQPDAQNDPQFKRQLLDWYALPGSPVCPPVGGQPANIWGIHDLHGLVWEWVADFNSALVADDSRGGTGQDRTLFCGSGAQGATDVENYPAFMRYAFRSSLKAGYCVHNLGFRCAKDL